MNSQTRNTESGILRDAHPRPVKGCSLSRNRLSQAFFIISSFLLPIQLYLSAETCHWTAGVRKAESTSPIALTSAYLQSGGATPGKSSRKDQRLLPLSRIPLISQICYYQRSKQTFLTPFPEQWLKSFP